MQISTLRTRVRTALSKTSKMRSPEGTKDTACSVGLTGGQAPHVVGNGVSSFQVHHCTRFQASMLDKFRSSDEMTRRWVHQAWTRTPFLDHV